MTNRFIVIDGKRYLWADILKMRKEQRVLQFQQPALFPLREDVRPPSQLTADGRHLEPTLLEYLKDH
jgi:hypothetical protein